MMPRVRASIFGLILLIYLIAGGLYAGLTPAWQAPDEPAHYNYVRYLATQFTFPELVMGCYDQAYLNELTSRRFPPELPVAGICYEFHQPPLYYLLVMPMFWLTAGSLLALRLFSMVLGAGVVVLAFFVARAIFSNRPVIAYGTMAFVAFVPMHVAMLASVNNDALAELILAAILLMLTRRLMQNKNQQDVILGILLGLGLITKMTVYIALPLVAVALWLEVSKRGKSSESGRVWPKFVKQAVLIYAIAFFIALPWYVRNAALYGPLDIWGLERHDTVVVSQLRAADYLAEVGWAAYLGDFITTTFRSFWGQFGWMAVPMDGRTYQLLTILTVMVLGGLAGFTIYDPSTSLRTGLRFRSNSGNRSQPYPSSATSACPVTMAQRQALTLMALTVGLMFLAYIWYNLNFKQFQGRYLFPAMIPLGLFFAVGLQEVFARQWRWWVVAGLSLALVWVGAVSALKSGLDKWGILIVGLALGVTLGRALLARSWFIPTTWLMIVCLGGVALLALFSPFWFVLPYLSS